MRCTCRFCLIQRNKYVDRIFDIKNRNIDIVLVIDMHT